MADGNPAAASSEDSEQHVTFNVKSSSEAKYVLTVPLSLTVADLKQKLSTSEYADIPPERQRLIYSGRVLKDPDTLATCRIKDGNTLHLVRAADSNQRQNPANQGGATPAPSAAGQPAANVPSNIAAGMGAANPLAQLTGARYAGFHGLPGADMFGADGGMGAPPNPDQMLRLLDDPNFASQMNEAMNNPAVLDMLRNSPMVRNNPMVRAAIENPEMRRMMFNPEMIRMQMQMQRSMGSGGMPGAGNNSFPMPGQTDTSATSTAPTEPATNPPPANPFAALFPSGNPNPSSTDNNPSTGAGGNPAPNPMANLFGGSGAGGANPSSNPFQAMSQQLMQNPAMMQQMMQAFGGGGGGDAGDGGAGFNPFGFGGGIPEPQAPADTRPPEERYAEQLRQLNDMGFFEFDRNVMALRRSGGSVQGAIEYLLSNP